ncbi:MAG TPA: choice-of-anchor tandem repeat GloVer-containing protein [Candidatus Acidoferrales bacterium]|jgi:uncharacterized repeat protein (TIGR03803 family)|nr:choice-of-anchor tandem repeat GloVer-containing protein [Candidatus Acidoferrales bacterium]
MQFLKSSALIVAFAVTACSQQMVSKQGSAPVPERFTDATVPSAFKTIHVFEGNRDGGGPQGLVAFHGSLYGSLGSGRNDDLSGAVFSIDTNGREHALVRIPGPPGQAPLPNLVVLNGHLYGATQFGGTRHRGSVFEVPASGAARVIHSFSPGGDQPSSLVAFNGALFGTTMLGGIRQCPPYAGCGVIFEMNRAGAEKVVYRFTGGTDGGLPFMNLTVWNGQLYGVTAGGYTTSASPLTFGAPTAFAFDPASGKLRTITTFSGNDHPNSALSVANGRLYLEGDGGNGDILEIRTSGKRRVVYSFKGSPDGHRPEGGLTYQNGVLYGTTFSGGIANDGTVFAVTPSGDERILHSFTGGRDGQRATAGVTFYAGALFGGTCCPENRSGPSSPVKGTVFKLTP